MTLRSEPPVKICARGGCTAAIKTLPHWLLERRRFCSRTCGALAKYTVTVKPTPTPCKGPQCPHMGRPVYCSRKCAAVVNAKARVEGFYAAIGETGRESRRKVGHDVLDGVALSLMRAGRYREAARLLYDKGYSAGWTAKHVGVRQLPARKAS